MFTHFVDLSGFKVVESEFNWWLVGLSIIFAIVATYAALSLNERTKNYSFLNRNVWIIAASFAMAFGIWSMHYMGMVAFILPVDINYHGGITVVSVVPAIVSAYLAFYLINQNKITITKAIVFSVFMSVGVITMHWLGMLSMKMDLMHHMNMSGMVLSFLTSFTGFFILCSFYQHLHKESMRILISVIVGFAVSGTHYIAKYSMVFYTDITKFIPKETVQSPDRYYVAMFLTAGLLSIATFLIIWTIYDYYMVDKSSKIDAQTHLPNNQQLQDYISSETYNSMAIIKFLDLNKINRLYGYHIGDEYIVYVSNVLKSTANNKVHIYRVAVNQFLLASSIDEEEFLEILHSIIKQLEQPFIHNEVSIHITGVCGYAHDEQQRGEELLNYTSSIMRCSNLPQDFTIVHYNQHEHMVDLQYEILKSVDAALTNGEMFLVYQPKYKGKTGEMVGCEALIRWHHTSFGFLSPGVFIPILEANNKMEEVTNWVINEVCIQLKKWKETGIDMQHISINIPGDYLTSPHLTEALDSSTMLHNISPQQIELEITETSFVGNLEKAMRAVNTYRQKGYSVALDDFGTGLSSLSYLRQMQINTLKIDKSFVDFVPYNTKDTSIFLAILSLGQSLSLNMVIEGVEKEEQVHFINEHCDQPIIQGYYFSKPLMVEELEEKLQGLNNIKIQVQR